MVRRLTLRKLTWGELRLGIPILSVGALVIGLILNSGIVTILSIVAIVIFAMAIIPGSVAKTGMGEGLLEPWVR